MKNKRSILGGILLVSGTCIGAGMIGLPVVTAASGFFPSIFMVLIVFFFMTCSALAYLEIALFFSNEINLITLVSKTLGMSSQVISWVIYVLFLYSLMAGYTDGISVIISNIDISPFTSFTPSLLSIFTVIPFSIIVYLGTLWVDRLNRLLMICLSLSFLYMSISFFYLPSPEHKINAFGPLNYIWFPLPLLVTSFGYHTIIPTLKSYYHNNVKQLKIILVMGGGIPCIIYIIWEFIILYIIPTWGDNGLVNMLSNELNFNASISNAIKIQSVVVHRSILFFSFFALTSSFIGLSMGIFDFLSDGLNIEKTNLGKFILIILTFVPPIVYTIVWPGGFINFLNYSGIFAAILFIIFPTIMVWQGRYINRLYNKNKYVLFDSKLLLGLTFIFGILIIFSKILNLKSIGILPMPLN